MNGTAPLEVLAKDKEPSYNAQRCRMAVCIAMVFSWTCINQRKSAGISLSAHNCLIVEQDRTMGTPKIAKQKGNLLRWEANKLSQTLLGGEKYGNIKGTGPVTLFWLSSHLFLEYNILLAWNTVESSFYITDPLLFCLVLVTFSDI